MHDKGRGLQPLAHAGSAHIYLWKLKLLGLLMKKKASVIQLNQIRATNQRGVRCLSVAKRHLTSRQEHDSQHKHREEDWRRRGGSRRNHFARWSSYCTGARHGTALGAPHQLQPTAATMKSENPGGARCLSLGAPPPELLDGSGRAVRAVPVCAAELNSFWTRPRAFNRSAAGSDRAFRVLTPPAAGDHSTSDLSPHLHAFPVPCAASTADSSSRKRRGWRNAPIAATLEFANGWSAPFFTGACP